LNQLWSTLSQAERVSVTLLLGASLVLNAIALLPGVPFLQISGILAPGPYSILKVIELLWESKLYPLVALVVGFSVLFPPAKLAIAAWGAWAQVDPSKRAKVLGVLGQLGRWSLLDVFVCLLIVLVLSEQGLTGATIAYGLYCFTTAIIFSMIAGAILHAAAERAQGSRGDRPGDRPDDEASEPGDTPSTSLLMEMGSPGAIAAGIIAVGLLAVAGSFWLIMFRVDQFGLWGNEWSLEKAIAHFFEHGMAPFGVVVAAFLVVAPAAASGSLLFTLCAPLSPAGRQRWYRRARSITEWAMLDVFAFGMLLYLVEQSNFAKLDLQFGAWAVFGAALVFTVGHWWAVGRVRGTMAWA